jgi:hypothetical protein
VIRVLDIICSPPILDDLVICERSWIATRRLRRRRTSFVGHVFARESCRVIDVRRHKKVRTRGRALEVYTNKEKTSQKDGTIDPEFQRIEDNEQREWLRGSALCLPISEQRHDIPQDMWCTYLFFVTDRVTRVAVKMHVDLEPPSRDSSTDSSSTAKLKGPVAYCNRAIIIYTL